MLTLALSHMIPKTTRTVRIARASSDGDVRMSGARYVQGGALRGELDFGREARKERRGNLHCQRP